MRSYGKLSSDFNGGQIKFINFSWKSEILLEGKRFPCRLLRFKKNVNTTQDLTEGFLEKFRQRRSCWIDAYWVLFCSFYERTRGIEPWLILNPIWFNLCWQSQKAFKSSKEFPASWFRENESRNFLAAPIALIGFPENYRRKVSRFPLENILKLIVLPVASRWRSSPEFSSHELPCAECFLQNALIFHWSCVYGSNKQSEIFSLFWLSNATKVRWCLCENFDWCSPCFILKRDFHLG